MIRKLISFVFLIVIGWLIYTQLFGTEKEQQLGQEVIDNGKKTIQSIFSIFKHENNKIKGGAYDDTLEKVGKLLKEVGQKLESKEEKEELKELLNEKERIHNSVEENKAKQDSIIDAQNKDDLQKLVRKIDVLLNEL